MAGEIAQVYAEALFELYSENGHDDQIYSDINSYADVFRSNTELEELLSSPLMTSEEKADVLKRVFDDDSITGDFIHLLCDKGRISYLDRIKDFFNIRYNEFKNITEVTVITSTPLTDELRLKVTAMLGRKIKKEIRLIEKTDPSIIDGIIIDYNNRRIDSSVRARLDSMRSSVTDSNV
ncbi:MAG: ATP synthase F1 subunit delta [Oscillospiraceae bacterium]|nr:ATP synthase F1 subunit delta [Oscillospiraceae bacterium]